MKSDFPEYEKMRYEAIIKKDIKWLKINLDNKYTHLHSNGVIEKKDLYLKNISSDNIKFKIMEPLDWEIREDSRFIFITGLSNFKLHYYKKFLDLKLIYHSIWKLDLSPKCFSWQATKV